jgi:hypothetical protein
MRINNWQWGAVILAGLIMGQATAPGAWAISEVPAPGKSDSLPSATPVQPQQPQIQPQQFIPGVTIEVQPATPMPRPGIPEIGLQGEAIGKSIDIQIPGMGSVGALPKFDFGLDLLYTPKQTPTPEDPSKDDVVIKGTLKHRF